MTNFRPWIYFDSVLSLCNRQDGHKSSSHSQWSWGPNKVSSGGSQSDHSGCQEAQTGNIFRNRLYSRDAGWGLIDLTRLLDQLSITCIEMDSGARNQELEVREPGHSSVSRDDESTFDENVPTNKGCIHFISMSSLKPDISNSENPVAQ